MPTPATDPPFARVGIVGLGLIGGSVALGLRAAWPSIHLVGVDAADIIDVALARRVIDETRPSPRALADVDLIVLATPVRAIIDAVRDFGRATVSTVITDVGSTKRRVLEAAEADGLTNFIGGHPMAGSERGGLDGARADLFAGKTWFITPGSSATADARERVEQLVRVLGASPVPIEADVHDRTVAYLSHLPQLIAGWLMVTAGEAVGEQRLQYSGRGFDDMTRLAASSAGMWESIVETNADYIDEACRAFAATLPVTTTADVSRLRDFFSRANRWRERLDDARRPSH